MELIWEKIGLNKEGWQMGGWSGRSGCLLDWRIGLIKKGLIKVFGVD